MDQLINQDALGLHQGFVAGLGGVLRGLIHPRLFLSRQRLIIGVAHYKHGDVGQVVEHRDIILDLVKLPGHNGDDGVVLAVAELLLQGGKQLGEGDRHRGGAQLLKGGQLGGIALHADLQALQISRAVDLFAIIGDGPHSQVHKSLGADAGVRQQLSGHGITGLAGHDLIGHLVGRIHKWNVHGGEGGGIVAPVGLSHLRHLKSSAQQTVDDIVRGRRQLVGGVNLRHHGAAGQLLNTVYKGLEHHAGSGGAVVGSAHGHRQPQNLGAGGRVGVIRDLIDVPGQAHGHIFVSARRLRGFFAISCRRAAAIGRAVHRSAAQAAARAQHCQDQEERKDLGKILLHFCFLQNFFISSHRFPAE